jgi:hypothetical protein
LWYQLLNLGCRLPIVSADPLIHSMRSDLLIGRTRTYARLDPDQELTYTHWIDAVRAGRTFVTRGPLLDFRVNDHGPGAVISLAENGPPLAVTAVAQAIEPVERVELVHNGEVIGEAHAGPDGAAKLEQMVATRESVWLAARCWTKESLAAHTSPVYLEGRPAPVDRRAVDEVLKLLEFTPDPASPAAGAIRDTLEEARIRIRKKLS